MSCPNCGSYRYCDCTWDERSRAMEIRRRRAREFRRKIGQPTVVEQEDERLRRIVKGVPNAQT